MKKYNFSILLLLFSFFVMNLISYPTATEVQSHSITINKDGTYLYDGTEVEQFVLYGAGKAEQYRTYLYLDDGTPVTFRYLLENPDFSITFTSVQDSELFFNTDFCKNEAGSALGFKNLSVGESVVIDHNVKFKVSATTQTLDTLFGENGLWSQYIDNHIYFFSKHFSDGQTFTLTSTGYVDNTDDEIGGVVDGTEEDDNTGILKGIKEFFTSMFDGLKSFFSELWNAILQGWLHEWNSFLNLFDGLKTFFSNLWEDTKLWFSEQFAPLLEMIDTIKKRDEASDSFDAGFVGSLMYLVEQLENVTINPVMEMFDNIKAGTLGILQSIYEFPMIKELIVGSVAITIFSAVMMLLTTF